jgi:hypothetical protein
MTPMSRPARLPSVFTLLERLLSLRDKKTPRAARRRARTSLALEPLEERVLLSQVNWVGGSTGDWSVAANWSAGVLPTSADDAVIPVGVTVTHSWGNDAVNSLTSDGTLNITGGEVTLATSSRAADLNIDGGTLDGSGDVEVTGALTWTNGTMGGSGVTTIDSGATLTLGEQGYSYLTLLGGGSLVNAGTATWSGGSLNVGGSSTLDNQGLFTADGNESAVLDWVWTGSGYDTSGGTFRNENGATFVKDGGGTTSFDPGVAFDNQGTVTIPSGTLSLPAARRLPLATLPRCKAAHRCPGTY